MNNGYFHQFTKLFALFIFITACSGIKEMVPTITIALSTETPITTLTLTPTSPSTPTQTSSLIIRTVEITRVISVKQTVVVTATQTPYPAKDCFDKAMTQVEMNSCAALARELAETNLNEIVNKIELPVDEKIALEQMKSEWITQAERDCEFFYNRGSMAPMSRNLCIASRIEQYVNELTFAYLTP
jgi:uncharacterized protein YecT (DUF1311 family)